MFRRNQTLMKNSMKNTATLLTVLAVLTSAAAPATARQVSPDPQTDAQSAAQSTAQVDDIVVTARRTDAPIWEISRDEGTLILVGAISGVPRGVSWRPEALEAATRRADRILFPQVGQASISDVLRLIWRIRSVTRLPRGTTTADYLPPDVQARLEAVMANERNESWRTDSLVVLSMDLMNDKGGFEQRRTNGALDVIRRAAREARVPVRPVGIVRGDELIDNLITMPPSTYAACVEAAVGAAEAGPEGAAARIEAWRTRRVPEVLAQPLDQALGLCWPSGDPEISPLLRAQWTEAVAAALQEPGVTLAVSQLRLLAEPGGVLDQLEAQGFQIEGPEWRAR